MQRNPRLSVIVETKSIGEHADADGRDLLEQCLRAVAREVGGLDAEVLVMRGEAMEVDVAGACPGARVIDCPGGSYVEMKWAGTRAATGDLVTYMDGDCMPGPGWAHAIVAALADADVSAGRTRYESRSLPAVAAGFFDFGFVQGGPGRPPKGLLFHNLAMRREVALATPMDVRFRRTGGCGDLFTRLREGGARIVYRPDQLVIHHDDWRGGMWVRKRIRNGVDVAKLARLRGEGGPLTPAVVAARRLAADVLRLARRSDRDVTAATVPVVFVLAVIARALEGLAGVTAVVAPGLFARYG